MATRTIPLDGPLDLVRVVGIHVRGGADPTLRVGAAAAIPLNDAASTARKSEASIGLSGLVPWDPTDPGKAAMASKAVSARPATTRRRRTLEGP